MKTLHLCFMLCITVFLIGCAGRPKIKIANSPFVSKVNQYLEKSQNRYECSARGYSYTVDTQGQTTCTTTTDPGALNEAKRIRNGVLEDLLGIIDDNYADFIATLESKRSRGNFFADALELSASAAVGISKGERAIQVIGVALTGFRGGRKSVDLNFFKEHTTPILINKMDDNRAKVQVSVLQNMEKDIDKYSMKGAIRDIANYYNAGTLVRAFTELSKETAAQAKNSAESVEVLKGNVTISQIPSVEAASLSANVFAQRRSLARQVRDIQQLPNEDPGRAAKNDAIALKLETLWGDVEAEDKFKTTIAEMKQDQRYQAILAKTPNQRQPDEVLTLIAGLDVKVQSDAKLRQVLLEILKRANK